MKKWICLILIVSFLLSPWLIVNVEGQVTNLRIMAYPTTLNAGFNTTIIINIINDFESIYDVEVSLSFPQSQVTVTSPIAIGPSNWKFEKIKEGENVTVEPLVFVPKSAAGNGYLGSVLILYKRLGYISPYSETHTIGFYTKGQIEIVVYEFSVEPELPTAGSTVSITASLLNKGTITARFTNVSLVPDPILVLKPESYNYLGDVDPNSPSPFTLEATLNSDLKEGEYLIKIMAEYEDEESRAHIIENEVIVYVTEMIEEQPPKSIFEKIIETIIGELLYFLIGLSVIIILVAIVIKRRSSKSEFETEDSQT